MSERMPVISRLPKIFEENYKPKVDNTDRIKQFMSDPVWNDICDMMDAMLLDISAQLANPTHTPTIELIRSLQSELFSVKYLYALPSMMIDKIKEQAVMDAQMGQKEQKSQEDDFNAK